MPKQCPLCNITIEDYAQQCECGYDFCKNEVSQELLSERAAKIDLKWILLSYVICCLIGWHIVGFISAIICSFVKNIDIINDIIISVASHIGVKILISLILGKILNFPVLLIICLIRRKYIQRSFDHNKNRSTLTSDK